MTNANITKSYRTHAALVGNERVTCGIRKREEFSPCDRFGPSWDGAFLVTGLDLRDWRDSEIMEFLPSYVEGYIVRKTEKYTLIRYSGGHD